MNKLLTTAFALLCVIYTFGQTYPTDSISIGDVHSSDWMVYLEDADFKIEYKFADCDPKMGYDKEMVLLKITNTSRNFLAFDWHMIMYYSEECKTCDYYDEYHYAVNVNPESEEEGICDMYSDYQLKIFSRFNDVNFSEGESLMSFQLKDLTVTSVTVD